MKVYLSISNVGYLTSWKTFLKQLFVTVCRSNLRNPLLREFLWLTSENNSYSTLAGTNLTIPFSSMMTMK
ncbi:hypothetical protein Trydic_g16662 [Trypoxylus dichotomus]